ncbi:enhancer of mRNA-decapping protein 3-like isoform X2 [Watersipora subatra]
MMSQWIGQAINVECNDLGVFQGLVESIDSNTSTVTLRNIIKDGKPYERKSISILSDQIKSLYFIESTAILHGAESNTRVESSDDDRPHQRHKADKRKPAKVVRAKTVTEDDFPAKGNLLRRRSTSCSMNEVTEGIRSPRRSEQMPQYSKRQHIGLSDDCFSVTVESCQDDFDFEKNLAMFDKQKVFHDIENGRSNRLTPKKARDKFKHDELVIKASKTVRQIKLVDEPSSQDGSFFYTTDDGLDIPCISLETREKLFAFAASHGLSEQRRVDIVGRNTCDMIFQLIGGSNRLNPYNTHQTPTVMLFCGLNTQGRYGVSIATHLANHNVETIVFIPAPTPGSSLGQELALYDMSGKKRVSKHTELPTGPIDLIINCLDSPGANLSQESWYKCITNWCNTCRAHVLAVDPLSNGCVINTKWSVHIGLPQRLPRSAGQTYLCDASIPKRVFNHIGIKYRSPFSTKFCIPLHHEQ